jgi:hypothetical protein
MKTMLTETRAMPGLSWSVRAGHDCAGFNLAGDSVCKSCYAGQGSYNYPVVINAQAERAKWWDTTPDAELVEAFVSRLKNEVNFRWFDSGDGRNPRCFQIIREVVRGTTHTQHWIPTRCWPIEAFHPVLKALHSEPNACVRLSNLEFDKPVPMKMRRKLGIYTVSLASRKEENACPKQIHGSCDAAGCRDCWSKSKNVVSYFIHGKKVNWKVRLKK